ncbi:MAG: DNA-processing protein DprA [Clostridia bacterium]|nr:DNA-processing protein DprA [Clostridia bacterium]
MIYHVWLSRCSKLSCDKACRLICEFGSAQAVFEAGEHSLRQKIYLTPADIQALGDKNLQNAQDIIDKCAKKSIDIITFSDKRYPKRLREIHLPPVVLYIKGTLPDIDSLPVFGIVGSRKPTLDSAAFAGKMAKELTQAGMLIVSGMAQGVDSRAAEGALQSGSTIAVLGTAIDNPYPKSNWGLYRDIIKNGAVISEYPPGARTYPDSFIERNRIISGLSIGLLVVQAGKKSGSLKTARFAEDYGRYVFVSPGLPTSDDWEGSNELLRSGAFYTAGAQDILSQFDTVYNFNSIKNDERSSVCIPEGLSQQEQQVYLALTRPMRSDEIAQACGMSIEQVAGILTMMELMGIVEQTGTQTFTRK